MILYHFTDYWLVRTILKEGLKPGSFFDPDYDWPPANAVWLTTQNHQESIFGWSSLKEIRITLVIPSNDQRLVRWKRWLQRHDPHLLVAVHGATWVTYCWVYFGIVPASCIEAWEFTDLALKSLYDVE